MKKIFLIGLVTASVLMAAEGNSRQSMMDCIDNAQTKEEFLACKQQMKQGKMGVGISINDMKTKVLSKIEERIKKLESSKQCVQKAQSKEDLKKCRPERPQHMNRGGGQQGNQMMHRGMKKPMNENQGF